MKSINILVFMTFICGGLVSQDENITNSSVDPLKGKFRNVMQSIVKLNEFYKNDQTELYKNTIGDIHIKENELGKLRLQLTNRTEEEFTRESLAYLNVELDNGNPNNWNIYVHPNEFERTFNALKPGHILEIPSYDLGNQGPSLMNSDSYRDHFTGSANGSGVKIAIIDLGFDDLTQAANASATPSIASMTTYTHGTGALESNTDHGTSCLETAYDSADGATYYLHKVSTVSDLQDAIDDCISDGVDIISHSVAWFNTGWYDNEGDIADAFKDASDAGILIFTAAGNYGNQRHDRQLVWQDDDNDDFFNWTSTDEGNTFVIPAGCKFTVSLSWEGVPDPTFDDYDLYVYTSGGTLVAQSTNTDTYESLVFTNTTGSSVSYYCAIKNEGSDLNPFKLFLRNGCGPTLQFSTATNSMTHPALCTHVNNHSIGAVYRTDYNSTTTDPIANYSSQGPSIGGAIKPDLTGPTGTSTFANGGGDFTGTSCATPNVAGAAACLLSGHPGMTSENLFSLLKRKAVRYLDWGASGNDNIYGYGGVFLYDYNTNNIYVHSTDGTNNVIPPGGVFPWHNVEDYDVLGVAGKKVIFLTNDEASASTVLNKTMLLTTLGNGTSSRIIK